MRINRLFMAVAAGMVVAGCGGAGDEGGDTPPGLVSQFNAGSGGSNNSIMGCSSNSKGNALPPAEGKFYS